MRTYDFYLYEGCSDEADLTYLLPKIGVSRIAEIAVQLKSKHPGFLGLSLGLEEAHIVLQWLRIGRCRTLIVPEIYRTPQISVQQALPIAEEAINRKRIDLAPNMTVYEVALFTEQLMFFTFAAGVKEWLDEGRIPGALMASIDKVDGHVWGYHEFEEYLISTNQLT